MEGSFLSLLLYIPYCLKILKGMHWRLWKGKITRFRASKVWFWIPHLHIPTCALGHDTWCLWAPFLFRCMGIMTSTLQDCSGKLLSHSRCSGNANYCSSSLRFEAFLTKELLWHFYWRIPEIEGLACEFRDYSASAIEGVDVLVFIWVLRLKKT